MNNIIIFGNARSGNHAISYWLTPQFQDGVRCFNNYRYFRWKDEENLYRHTEHVDDGVKNNLFGVQNINLSVFEREREEWINKFKYDLTDLKVVALLRNPWNLIASHVQWKWRQPLYQRKSGAINRWNEYYGIYLENANDYVFVIYDKWFQDIEYRKEISKKLGLEFSDENLNLVSGEGNGSSFNKREYDGRAQQMNVLNRYKQIDNFSMNNFKESEIGQDLKNKWNHICDLEEIKELKIK
jgi:hypothetical protein